MLDWLTQILYWLLFVVFIEIISVGSSLEQTLIFIWVIPIVFYNPLMEYFFGGQTVGKMLVKIRVLRIDGSSATLSDVILRWLLRSIDTNVGLLVMLIVGTLGGKSNFYDTILGAAAIPVPIIGIISIMVTKNAQRLGDLAANTVVVSLKRNAKFEDTMLVKSRDNYKAVYPQVLQLKDKDMYTIKDVLSKAIKSNNYDNVDKLAQKAAKLLKVTPQENSSASFLKKVIEDYNHLSREEDKNPFAGRKAG